MSLIGQMLSASYAAVVNELRQPANQWASSPALKALEKSGILIKEQLGPTIEHQLDYQSNPSAGFVTNGDDVTGNALTTVITTASYTPAELQVPITYTLREEAENPTENQKIALVKAKIQNGLDSHDEVVEYALFANTGGTNGFNTFVDVVAEDGLGVVGTIDANTSVFWRCVHGTANVAAGEIESAFTHVYINASKGVGVGQNEPSLIITSSNGFAVLESSQQAFQRWEDNQDWKIGAKTLMFKNAKIVASPKCGEAAYFLNSKNCTVTVSKGYFRQLGEVVPHPGANLFTRRISSFLQLTARNRSRLAVCALTSE